MQNLEKIWNSPQLPTLPTVAVRLLELSRNPETEIRDVVEVIKADPAITAKILKATNSSFFAFRSQITTIDRAVPLLGTTLVTSLALSFSLVEAAMTTGPMAAHYNAYWKQSILQACAAEVLAKLSDRGKESEHFLAGLLADLGRLAMLKTIPRDYLPVLEAAQHPERSLVSVESEMLGVNHAEVGVKLMEVWKLPASLSEAIRLHHADLQTLVDLPRGPEHALARCVAVAAAAGDYFCNPNKGAALQRLQKLTQAYHGFSDEALNKFLAETRARADQAGDLFSVRFDELGEPSELMALASEQLAQLALREFVASTQATARREIAEQQQRELESKNVQLQQQALHDPLTRVYNRNFFDESLKNAVAAAGRAAESVGVIFADIDKFKSLNDTYGHPFGDKVLQKVAEVYGQVIRNSDVLARYGGEEFVVLVPQTTENGLWKLAERVRQHVEAAEIFLEDKRVPVTISVGAAIGIPERNPTDFGSRLVAAADEAMYEAKQNGRNQVRTRTLLTEAERRFAQKVLECRFSRWLATRKIYDVASVSKALLQCNFPRLRIGELAQKAGILSAAQVDELRQLQDSRGERFGQLAAELGYLSDDGLVRLLAQQKEDPTVLSKALVAAGLATSNEAAALLERFQSEFGIVSVTCERSQTAPAPIAHA